MRACGRRLGVALLRVCLGLSSALLTESLPAPAFAQTEAEIAAARALFGEAVKDEDSGYFETALGKFRKVQEVKDTANVRYRIATCYEGLGQRARALAAYRSVLEVGEGDKTAKDAMRVSREKIEQLERIVAHLTIVVPASAPSDTEVFLDNEKLTPPQLSSDLVIDAGPHTIAATSKDRSPFRTQVALPEGGRASVTVPFEPPVAVPMPSASASPSSSAPPPAPSSSARPIETPPPDGSLKTLGWVSIAGGAAFLAASGVALALRQHEIDTIKSTCNLPGGNCPVSKKSDLTSAHDRATLEGPLAIGFGAVGVAALGLGIYFLAKPPAEDATPRASIRVTPVLSPREAGIGVRGSF